MSARWICVAIAIACILTGPRGARRRSDAPRRVWAIAIAAAMAAGCTAPANTHGTGAGAPAIISASSVDLHNFTLSITMPAGQPSALVVLNVTKDMWVRPFVGNDEAQLTPARAPTFWVLCPWIKSNGLNAEWRYVPLPFWVRGQHLVPAAPVPLGQLGGRNDSNSRACATFVGTDVRIAAISTDSPYEGQLAIVVAVYRFPNERSEGNGSEAPKFHLRVGIGRETCANDPQTLCPPAADSPAAATLRGRNSTYVFIDTAPHGFGPPSVKDECKDCGFKVQDDRTHVAVPTDCPVGFPCEVETGSLAASRVSSDAVGIVLAHAYHNYVGPTPTRPTDHALTVELGTDGTRSSASCSNPDYAEIYITASHASPSTYLARLQTTGSDIWGVGMLEIPLDIAPLGWSIPPSIGISTQPAEHAGPSAASCP